MPRMARLVVPGYPHHVTQRGNRRQQTFYTDADYRFYIALLDELRDAAGIDIWAYCLMPNHIHMIVVPKHAQSLAKFFGVAHHRYARHVNVIHDWRGHLWQERFHSFVMDEKHLLSAVRYVELNPVRAGLCNYADEWRWSSARMHCHDIPDPLMTVAPMRDFISNWAAYLSADVASATYNSLRRHTRTGRPAGDAAFINTLEAITGRQLSIRKPGPKAGK